MSNKRRLRSSCATSVSTGSTRMPDRALLTATPAGPVPYSGWTLQADSASRAGARIARRSNHDIDDPLRHHDDPAGSLAFERALHRLVGERRAFNISLRRGRRDCQFGALLAVDLHRKGD